MQKRYVPVAVSTVLLAVLSIVGYALPPQSEKIPQRILFDNAGGKVVFDHRVHAAEYDIACQTCHHENTTARDAVKPCGTCHGVTFDAAFRKDHATAINDLPSCATCHHMTFKPAPWGHEAHSKEYGVECRDCHHTDTAIEPEPQNCADCHQQQGDAAMPALKDAVHAKCAACHEEKFARALKGCADCHTQVPTRQELAAEGNIDVKPPYADCATCHTKTPAELIPNRMEAFHGQCMGCHEKLGKGPFGKTQCNRCHTR